jgi:hypothetical protein
MLPGSKLQRLVWRDVQKKKEGHHWYWRKMAVFVPSAVIRLPGELPGWLVRQQNGHISAEQAARQKSRCLFRTGGRWTPAFANLAAGVPTITFSSRRFSVLLRSDAVPLCHCGS